MLHRDFSEWETIQCTSCGMCVERCPMGLDIPKMIALYNEFNETGGENVFREIGDLPEDKRPDKCIGCGSCQMVCPEKIEIWKTMGRFANKLKG